MINTFRRRTRSRLRLHGRVPLAVALLGCAACSGAEPGEPAALSELGTLGQALAGYGTGEWDGPVDYWDLNDYEVPVCYLTNPANTGNAADYFAEFADALVEVEAIAGIAIDWHGPCSTVPAGALEEYIPIIFNDQGGWGGLAGPGFKKRRTGAGFPGTFQIGITFDAARTQYQLTAVHEFLHALGMPHEQQRPDSEATCPAALEPGGNNVEVPGADLFTPYDDESVMNYCRTNRENGLLTYYDRTGLGVVYPKTFTRGLRGSSTLVVGNGLLSRGGGHLYPDWIDQGALNAMVSSLTWRIGGIVAGSGPRLPLGTANVTISVRGNMTDFLGRAHTIPTTSVTIDNAKHAALVTSTYGLVNLL